MVGSRAHRPPSAAVVLVLVAVLLGGCGFPWSEPAAPATAVAAAVTVLAAAVTVLALGACEGVGELAFVLGAHGWDACGGVVVALLGE